MGVILGLEVRVGGDRREEGGVLGWRGGRQGWMKKPGEGGEAGWEQREQDRREIWEVTVNTHARRYNHTINIERHKHRRVVWGRKTKAQEK